MNLNISARHVELTPAMESYAKSKFERVWKHFDVVSAHLRLIDEPSAKGEKIAQADVRIKGKAIHLQEAHSDLYAAIDALADRAHLALSKEKEKQVDRQQCG